MGFKPGAAIWYAQTNPLSYGTLAWLPVLKNGPLRPRFLYFRLFNTVDSKQMVNINFAYDWSQTANLWYWKQPLYHMSHNHCPAWLPVCVSVSDASWGHFVWWASSCRTCTGTPPLRPTSLARCVGCTMNNLKRENSFSSFLKKQWLMYIQCDQ